MSEKILELSNGAKLVHTTYGDPVVSMGVELEYEERQGDPWYSDSNTCVDIDRDMAIKIIQFLAEAHGIDAAEIGSQS